MPISKVLVANRGEIAVRILRGCRDAGLSSVAVYADQDRDAVHTRLADEAFALDGTAPAATYLDIDKLVTIARRSGADAVHPGYGFLAENAEFARACLDAGLVWIGPPPAAIEALGDKVRARHIAAAVGAPLVPGTPDPVNAVGDVLAFADEHGLPIAIKAAFGGGGRGLKVARTREEIPAQFDSAVREAVAAFGRGECFVERYLDRPRHVETQCLADVQGSVVVVSTRDCSLQRRHQKLVEEAPAPALSATQLATLYESSKKILAEAGYVGAGTCEFLVGADATISFLEVNTRLQVEHPVTEEVTGIDLVRAMFRIADGEPLGFDDPVARGCSIEFRINAEDPGRSFLPAPGTLTRWVAPSGPGVRVDAGYVAGDTVPSEFDSLIGKLVVSGATRVEALERARRALAEFEVDGMPTVLPFHRAVVDDPAFAPLDDADFAVHTRWIEDEFAASTPLPAWSGVAADGTETAERVPVTVEVGGRRLEVVLPGGLTATAGTGGGAGANVALSTGASATGAGRPGRRSGPKKQAPVASGNALTSPMQGTIVKVLVDDGDEVAEGDLVVVLEAMKMEQPITAHRSGTVAKLTAEVGVTVPSGHVLAEIGD